MTNNKDMVAHIKDSIKIMIAKAYDEAEKRILVDEFGTTDPYKALGIVWTAQIIPDEDVFRIIDEFKLDPYSLPDKLREAYIEWKYPPKVKPITEPKVTPAVDVLRPEIEPSVIIPRPKKRRVIWKGIVLGEEDLGEELYVYGKIIKDQYAQKLSKYPADVVEATIEYVRQKYPHLDENTAPFWQTVECRVQEYQRFGRFII